jgi:hypothetical protein
MRMYGRPGPASGEPGVAERPLGFLVRVISGVARGPAVEVSRRLWLCRGIFSAAISAKVCGVAARFFLRGRNFEANSRSKGLYFALRVRLRVMRHRRS